MSPSLAGLLPEQHFPAELARRNVSALTLDSRRLKPGETFVAIPGNEADGRDYIDQAIASGAAMVLAEQDRAEVTLRRDVPVIGVPRLSRELGYLAARLHGEPARALRVFGITGTNGKTSTAWFLREALEAAGLSCGLVGTLGMSFRDEWQSTVHTTPDPLTLHAGLARFRDAGARAVVMEVSSHALSQQRLQAVPVAVAVFTNLSRDHLDYHESMEAYFEAKASLFQAEGLELAVINADDPAGRQLIGQLPQGVRCLTFGSSEQADVRCTDFRARPSGLDCTLCIKGRNLSLSTTLYGRFNLQNLLAVAAVLQGCGTRAEDMGPALQAITPVPGRMEPVGAQPGPRVLVDYAHTPDALEQALQAVRAHFSGRLWCVVGCGGDRDAGKRPQMAAAAERFADCVVLTSDNPRSESPAGIIDDMWQGLAHPQQARRVEDRAAAVEAAITAAGEEDVVLIAGKGHETWQEINGVRHPMDDRQLASDALRRRHGEGL